MSERKLYSYSEFIKTRKPPQMLFHAFESLNAQLRGSLPELQGYWQDHLDKSKAAIQKAAGKAGTAKAIIFGAGNCSDIPLAELVDRFDHLTVVDIEPQGVTKAVEALPGNLQAKVAIQIEDLTSITAETFETFSVLLSQAKNPTDFAERVLASLPGIQPKIPDFGNNQDFVCSNLLGSQLTAFVGVAFAILGNSKYPQAGFNEDSITIKALGAKRPDLINNLGFGFQEAHIDLLLRSAKRPEGIVYFADTFEQAYLRRNPFSMQPYFIDEQGRPVSNPHKMQILAISNDTIDKLRLKTTVVDTQEWIWYRLPPQGTAVGKIYGVRSFTFETK